MQCHSAPWAAEDLSFPSISFTLLCLTVDAIKEVLDYLGAELIGFTPPSV